MYLPLIYAIFYFIILSIFNYLGGYGIFVDEFYYLACSKRLALGYIDHPPLSIYLLSLFRITGDSIFILRVIPAFCAGASVYFVGELTKRLNGNNLSISLSCIAMMTVPVLQVIFGFYSMNAIEIFFVIILIFSVLKIKENSNYWIVIGAIVGLGLFNKHTFIIYTVAILTPYLFLNFRTVIRSKTFYIGMVLSIVIFSPNLYWQYSNNLPSLEFYKNAHTFKNMNIGYIQIISDQILSQNPATLPLWICGILFCFRNKDFKFIGIAYLILLLIFLYSKSSRPDRIAAFYPILFACGAAFITKDSLKKFLLSIIIIVGLSLSPIGLPILPLDVLSNYVTTLGIVPQLETGKTVVLPQWFADRLDWEEFHSQIQLSIDSLDESEKNETIVIGNNYGQAGSLEYYKISLPIISGHNSYYLWMEELKISPKNLIVIGDRIVGSLEPFFEEKFLIGSYSRKYSTENEIPIYFLKKSKIDTRGIFSKLKIYR
ncbi:glycosyltransferase family 39 protein [Leptospira sp. GIMC2001]|uniref:glycosyltransferase family 39 protein n=1 Tax=Leptospira sp. GIMC2001 TaxID=1513297 RepID=UPI0023493DB7|nr:glycosyltransferase family 39 protein [Leptospira sp. GIMC2001]WCL49643.1 glycosyltransferase family 39 protein [Leptospira sp. GIMC2001]